MIVMGMTGIYKRPDRGCHRSGGQGQGGLVGRAAGHSWPVRGDLPRAGAASRTVCSPSPAWPVLGPSYPTRSSGNTKASRLRIVVQGPIVAGRTNGAWLPLVAGRPLRAAHYEMIADRSLRLRRSDIVAGQGYIHGSWPDPRHGWQRGRRHGLLQPVAIAGDPVRPARRGNPSGQGGTPRTGRGVDLGRLRPVLIHRRPGWPRGFRHSRRRKSAPSWWRSDPVPM